MKIAIVKVSAIGDIIHAMVILQFIKEYNENIDIDWIVEENYRELLEFNPDIRKVHVVNFKKAKKKKSLYILLNELIRVRRLDSYDLVIDMQGLIKSAIISRLIPSSLTLGFDKSSIRESIASIFYNKKFHYGYDKNIIERNVALINYALGLNISKQKINNKFPFLYSNKKYINYYLSNIHKNILLVPGASFKAKLYPINKFAEIANKLDGNVLVIWGNSKEKILADEMKVKAPNISVCDGLSICSLISLISQVDLVIGPDTGPTHMAWALNVPSITLFGPTPGKRNSYATRKNRVLESNSEVNPYKIDKYDNTIKDISVNEILEISHDLLNQ